jgi:hypothetical protein
VRNGSSTLARSRGASSKRPSSFTATAKSWNWRATSAELRRGRGNFASQHQYGKQVADAQRAVLQLDAANAHNGERHEILRQVRYPEEAA